MCIWAALIYDDARRATALRSISGEDLPTYVTEGQRCFLPLSNETDDD